MSFDFDLLGDPIPEGWGKRGRPPHVPTEEKRKLVMQLLAFGWTIEKIAAALGITPPTLRKNYFRELKVRAEARARVEARLIGSLMREAEAGNVSAIDKYFRRLEKADLDALADRVAHRVGGSAKAEKKLGKKEDLRRQAGEISGKFAPPAGPRLIN